MEAAVVESYYISVDPTQFIPYIEPSFYILRQSESSPCCAWGCLAILDINNEMILIKRLALAADARTVTAGDVRRCTADWLSV